MNKLLTTLLSLGAFFLVNSLHAQDLKTYLPLFKSLNKGERVQFLASLRDLTNKVHGADQLQDDVFKDLRNGLPVTNPTEGIDSILQAWVLPSMQMYSISG